MTQYTQADVDMADRHIAQSERRIIQQEGVLTRLRTQAQDAENLLKTLNSTMSEYRAHRTAIMAALEASSL